MAHRAPGHRLHLTGLVLMTTLRGFLVHEVVEQVNRSLQRVIRVEGKSSVRLGWAPNGRTLFTSRLYSVT